MLTMFQDARTDGQGTNSMPTATLRWSEA